MIEINGKYGKAKVMTNHIEKTAVAQVEELCNQPWTKNIPIRIMPDCHAGKGCVIGLTMPVKETVVSNLVGVDIGCGMEVVKVANKELNYKKLDKVITNKIPAGREVRKKVHPYFEKLNLKELRCWHAIAQHQDRVQLSLGSLGGGNHFIEANKGEDGCHYIVIHSGSRQLGTLVANYYQNRAEKKLKKDSENPPHYLAPLQGQDLEDYLHDLIITQEYAKWNRKAMMNEIIEGCELEVIGQWTTIHNYIEPETNMLRKGAISAHRGELLIIPLNMKDGSIVGIGKGTKEWNESAPHGAGRLMSRQQAKKELKIEDYIEIMEGIYSTSLSHHTLDEAPMAYKDMQVILEHLNETVEIIEIIKPVYNFKAQN